MDNKQILYDLFKAYYDARKNKRNTIDQLKFELNLEENLIKLYDEIINGNYKISTSIYFINNYPIKREIFAGNFRDRVVHHLIYNYLYLAFEKHFIFDSYSCRVGKGTSLGIRRVSKFIRSCSNNYTQDCYILKLDIQGYFMSIDKNILYKKLVEFISCREHGPVFPTKPFPTELILTIIKEIIYNDPTKNAIFKGKKEDYIGLPKNKSLFFANNLCGLPIGNLTSQLFSNIYLDEFDKFMKYVVKCKYYGRYVDDFVIIHNDKNFLKLLIPKIKLYLKENLGLSLHPNKVYLQHYSKGVLFLGNVIKPYRNYIKKSTLGNFYQTINKINKKFEKGELKTLYDYKKNILSPLNSYLGIIKNNKTQKIKIKILKKLNLKILSFFYIDNKFNKIIIKYDKLGKFTNLQNKLGFTHFDI